MLAFSPFIVAYVLLVMFVAIAVVVAILRKRRTCQEIEANGGRD
jgi:hypothetical protein